MSEETAADRADDNRLRDIFDTREDFPRCEVQSPHGDTCTLESDHEDLHRTDGASWGRVDAVRCESKPEPYGWAVTTTRCTLAAGHGGDHNDGAGLSWKVGTAERSGWRGFLDQIPAPFARALLDSPGQMRILDDPRPVRVRFVDLPSTREVRPILGGIPANIVTPGGFALVVDRFRDRQHRDAERATWEAWGESIGAATVLLYPGELDIVDYLDGN